MTTITVLINFADDALEALEICDFPTTLSDCCGKLRESCVKICFVLPDF